MSASSEKAMIKISATFSHEIGMDVPARVSLLWEQYKSKDYDH